MLVLSDSHGLVQVLADWSPAKLRELVCEGDPAFQQHADLLVARTASGASGNRPKQAYKPKVRHLEA